MTEKEDNSAKIDETIKETIKESSSVIEERREKLAKIFKKKDSFGLNIVVYVALALITILAVFIRTLNMKGLKDVTTGAWTLGPDLDPYLFLRWAEYIVQHGSLFVMDPMRYVPLGFNTAGEMKLLSYMIAWFYDFLSLFMKDVTVTYAAIIFPVFMFALTCIAFFFLTKEVFKPYFEKKVYPNLIALIATLFLAVIPSILPRTIAGIPEKESAGFLFIFLALLFLLLSYRSKGYKGAITWGALAGISTAILALLWGGITFVTMIIGIIFFVCYILGQIHKKEFASYTVWLLFFWPIAMIFSNRYDVGSFLSSTSTIPVYTTWILILFNLYAYPKIAEIKWIKSIKSRYHIPREILALIIVVIILVIASIFVFGPNFIIGQFKELWDSFIRVLGQSRFLLTVAENKQPHYDEWAYSFGPIIGNIPIFFWMFIIGAVWMMYTLLKNFEKKERRFLTVVYFIFIIAIIFSRYSESSILNGESFVSLFVYFGGMLLFFISFIYVIFKYNREDKKELLKIEIGWILMFVFFFIAMLAARSGVRFTMVLVPPASMIVGYLVVMSIINTQNKKDEMIKVISFIIAILLVIAAAYSAYAFYSTSRDQASGYYPGDSYHIQWQKAMGWVRNETPTNAVFAHWWDYGYWVQSIGERATILDGGNTYVYWDHLMGRNVLTSPNDKDALEFLYTHNGTHLLIDSTDIGKYPAFSSIGADENYDRYSFIPTLGLDPKSTKELADGIVYIYNGGSQIDEDIEWNNNGTEYILPKETTYLGAIMLKKNLSGEFMQPEAVFVQQNGQQVTIPLKKLRYHNTTYTYSTGLDAGFFLFETISTSSGKLGVSENGGGLYLSRRTVNSLLARKYLFGEEGNFKLVHIEQNPVVEQIRASGGNISDFVYYGGNLMGPIKIWEIQYPAGIKANPQYLNTSFPDPMLSLPVTGY
ncbi:MAG: STT3 domain-containing protein [Candidatus Pacearchaeota archaeon]|jgi:asparagine N-glycosylation enzyme membrane subunit Stt3